MPLLTFAKRAVTGRCNYQIAVRVRFLNNYHECGIVATAIAWWSLYAMIVKQGVWSAELRGRTPDSQSREPAFESTFAIVSKFGHFHSLHDAPVHSAV